MFREYPQSNKSHFTKGSTKHERIFATLEFSTRMNLDFMSIANMSKNTFFEPSIPPHTMIVQKTQQNEKPKKPSIHPLHPQLQKVLPKESKSQYNAMQQKKNQSKKSPSSPSPYVLFPPCSHFPKPIHPSILPYGLLTYPIS